MISEDVLKSFEGKKCLVTGGTGLIGRQVVKILCAAGADVLVASLDVACSGCVVSSMVIPPLRFWLGVRCFLNSFWFDIKKKLVFSFPKKNDDKKRFVDSKILLRKIEKLNITPKVFKSSVIFKQRKCRLALFRGYQGFGSLLWVRFLSWPTVYELNTHTPAKNESSNYSRTGKG